MLSSNFLLRCGAMTIATCAIASFGGAQTAQSRPQVHVVPLTRTGPGGEGFLADPQPIRLASSARGAEQFLSGTTQAVVRCPYPLHVQGCAWTPIKIDLADIKGEMAQAGVSRTNIQNINIYQADDGQWHAAVTVGVHSAEHPDHWTVVAHAHPNGPGASGGPPSAWTVDTLLAGDFATPLDGNYDAKYYQEDGQLYLLYVRNAHPKPGLRNEIVLQRLASFTRPAGAAMVLLTTGDRFGELNSEWYDNTKAKLVEAPWLTVIGGKHALIYSTGAYLTPGYKAGVAWSDTLVPTQGGHYRKVLQPDPQGIWRSAGGYDVRYLVQSQRPRWANFLGGEVAGPGVAAATKGPAGGWWLFFNGFRPSDIQPGPGGKVDGNRRMPFGLQLRASVPAGRSVAAASDTELATWLTPTN